VGACGDALRAIGLPSGQRGRHVILCADPVEHRAIACVGFRGTTLLLDGGLCGRESRKRRAGLVDERHELRRRFAEILRAVRIQRTLDQVNLEGVNR
jgi:hypothetical protein